MNPYRLILLSLAALALGALAHAEARQVRIVKQGVEHNRTNDGNVAGIASYHRYRIDRDPATGLWQIQAAGQDLETFHDLDVDGDGATDDDRASAHVFDLDLANPLTPVAPWYDTTVGTQRFYGAAVFLQANYPEGFSSVFSEDGMNDSEEGAVQQPRRNWTFFHETYEIGSPYRMYFLALWQKPDFLNGGADHRMRFDEGSELRHLVMRYNMGIEGFRWVVRNGEAFYISEVVYEGADERPGDTGGMIHRVHPASVRWARYQPEAPYRVWFDPAGATFERRDFDDVTAVGYLMFKDTLVSGYVGYKWYAFEADAVVEQPDAPSASLAMPEVEAEGLPPFFLSATETPYTLWRQVHRLARYNGFAGPRGFNFERYGDMGSMAFPGPDGEYLAHGPDEPATNMTFYDALAWCNALSQQESREPCYYVDAEFTQPFREAVRSPIWDDRGQRRAIYVKWSADGYRLPTPAEWQAAASASVAAAPGNTTLPVDSGEADAMGFHHLLGNVWEYVWIYGDMLGADGPASITALGGDFSGGKLSASAYGDRPYDGNGNIGFRALRRKVNLPAPPLGDTNKVPAWTFGADTVTAPVPARQLIAPLDAPWLEQLPLPGHDSSLGRCEVTYAEWMPVHDWAVAQGYDFDDDGDMGSMAYWGFGENWQPGVHTPDEPVTGVSKYDVMLWLNALSELEGRQPTYYLDQDFTEPARRAFVFRPMQMLLGEARELGHNGTLPLHRSHRNAFQDWYANPAADGYRLPELEEYEALVIAGGAYPLKEAALLDYAWLAENSGFRTHAVETRKAGSHGFHDLVGNVSELCNSGDTHKSYRRNSLGYCPQFGGSFLDVIQNKFPDRADGPVAMGLAWPDIGFRALRQRPPVAETSSTRPPLPPRGFIRAQAGKKAPAGLPAPSRSAPAPRARPAFDPLQGKAHRGNLYRNGVFAAAGLPELDGVRWKFQTGGPVRSSPVVVDGVVYVGSHDGTVYALSAADGRLHWKFETAGRVSGSAAVADGVVYIASEGGVLYALDAATGTLRWEAPLLGLCAGSPALVDGLVVIGQGTRYGGSDVLIMSAYPLVAFDQATGERRWQGSPGPQGYAAIATDGQACYAGFGGSNYAVFGLSNGKALHTWNAGHQARQFMSMTVDGDRLYIPVTMRGSVLCTSLDGKKLWHTATLDHNLEFEMNAGGLFGHEIFTDLAVTDTTVLAGCNDGLLYAFDKKTGTKGWTFPTGGEIHSSPSVADGIVYFGSWDGHLYAVDANSGELRWKHELGDRIFSAPWPGEGAVYVGCDDGAVYALD